MTDESWAVLFNAQINTNWPHFRSVAFKILREGGAAEDACQQAFLQAWERRSGLKEVDAIKGWITRIVVTQSLKSYHRRQKERARLFPAGSDHRSGWTELVDLVSSTESENSPRVVELRESVLLALELLPELERTVIVLRFMHGMAGSEISAELGCDTNEAFKILYSGLDRLRTLLAPWAQDGSRENKPGE